MISESRALWLPKDAGFSNEYEDAYDVNERRGIAAVADGVASAIFSRKWAQLLTRAIVQNPPDMHENSASFKEWLTDLRSAWADSIDMTGLKWHERQKLQQVGGAYCTLIWLELFPAKDAQRQDDQEERLDFQSFALGDCCLFHVRNRQILANFPMENPEAFRLDPLTVCSVDRNRDHLLTFKTLTGTCRQGDMIALVSDALAEWYIKQIEGEQLILWDEFWEMNQEQFLERVTFLREDHQMRYDDTTLLLLKIGPTVEGNEVDPFAEPEAGEVTVVTAMNGVVAEGKDESDAVVHTSGEPDERNSIVETPREPADLSDVLDTMITDRQDTDAESQQLDSNN